MKIEHLSGRLKFWVQARFSKFSVNLLLGYFAFLEFLLLKSMKEREGGTKEEERTKGKILERLKTAVFIANYTVKTVDQNFRNATSDIGRFT